ncbi:MAG: glycoside hydrolase family 99-like domain-containing protein [Marinilabilia sp.]
MKQRIFYLLSLLLVSGASGCGNNDATHSENEDPPSILEVTPELENTTVGSEIDFTCDVEYEDQSLLSYEWTSSCGKITNGANANTITWQTPDETGSCDINVTVSDGESSDEYSFSVLVEEDRDMVGVYYYPWHGGGDFHGRNYLREYLVPEQLPELGEYNDTEAHVIEQHIKWCEYAGINLLVSSWWGQDRMTDETMRNHVMKHPELDDMKIALFYESTSLLGDWDDVSNVASDIQHMAKYYFSHPNYYRINGRPVLFIYLTRVMANRGILEETLDIMREQASLDGFELFIVGDHVFGDPPSSAGKMDLLDAVTNYDVYGSSGGRDVLYATQEGVDNYYADQAEWKSWADQAGANFIPASAPGYNDTGVRQEALHQPLSRKLSEDAEFGSLFKAMLEGAQGLTDPDISNLFMITSWNEWHEDTQIEPVESAPPTSEDISGDGDYTYGLEYEGYGERYLDILKEAVEK